MNNYEQLLSSSSSSSHQMPDKNMEIKDHHLMRYAMSYPDLPLQQQQKYNEQEEDMHENGNNIQQPMLSNMAETLMPTEHYYTHHYYGDDDAPLNYYGMILLHPKKGKGWKFN